MNNLDKQYTDLVNDTYKNYLKKSESQFISNEDGTMTVTSPSSHYNFLTKEEFINKIKTDEVFAMKWGFQVYTKELSRRERSIYYYNNGNNDGVVEGSLDRPTFEENEVAHEWYNDRNVPKQVISFTYNNQTIEIYE